MLEQIGSSKTSGFGKNLLCALCGLGLLGIVGYGIYLIAFSQKDEHSSEVADLDTIIEWWMNETYPVFNSLSFVVLFKNTSYPLQKVETNDWPAESEELEAYTGIKYTTTEVLFHHAELVEVTKDTAQYDLLGELAVVVNNSVDLLISNVTVMKKEFRQENSKTCEMHQMGCWDLEVNKCVGFQQVIRLCVLFDEETMTWVPDYKQGCFGGGMETFEHLKWRECETDLEYSGSIELNIRSVNDPYIVSLEEGIETLAPKSETYLIGGILAIVGALICMAIPCVFFMHRPHFHLLK